MNRATCRLCDSSELETVVEFPDLPLVDAYTASPSAQPLYPCALRECKACGHLQLGEVIEADKLFANDYLFRTADYPWLVAHYRVYADAVWAEFKPASVLEIGSNDGSLLDMFSEKGAHVVGFDPSSVPAKVTTYREFFSTATAQKIESPAQLVIANHVFAHNDDLRSIVEGVRHCLAPAGTFIFETNAGRYLRERHLFDIVYHEHMDYHQALPMARFLDSCGLQLFRLEYNESKGGTMRGYACHRGARPVEHSVMQALYEEGRTAELYPWNWFIRRLLDRRQRMHDACEGSFKPIGYGAAAGGIATMWHLGLQDRIAWIVDDSQRRHGLYAPASGQPVKDTATLYNYETHHGFQKIVCLSWRYAREIRAKHPNLEIIVP